MVASRTLAYPLFFAGISILAVTSALLLPALISYLGPQESGVYTLPPWYWREHQVLLLEEAISIAAPIILGIASTVAGLLLGRNRRSLTATLQ